LHGLLESKVSTVKLSVLSLNRGLQSILKADLSLFLHNNPERIFYSIGNDMVGAMLKNDGEAYEIVTIK
jgi:hypothetical protein